MSKLFQAGLPDDCFEWETDPDEGIVVLSFPEITVAETGAFNPITKAEWEKAIITMPSRHACVWTKPVEAGAPQSGILQVVDVPDALPESSPQFQAYMRLAMEANSQSEEEIAAVERWRDEQIDLLNTVSIAPTAMPSDEGSPKVIPNEGSAKAIPKKPTSQTRVRPARPSAPKLPPPDANSSEKSTDETVSNTKRPAKAKPPVADSAKNIEPPSLTEKQKEDDSI